MKFPAHRILSAFVVLFLLSSCETTGDGKPTSTKTSTGTSTVSQTATQTVTATATATSTSTATSTASALDPAAYGLTVPSPEPALPAEIAAYAPPAPGTVSSSAPVISEYIRNAAPNESISMAGIGLASGQTKFAVFSQNSSAKSFVSVPALRSDGVTVSMTFPANLPAGMFVVFPEVNGVRGSPVFVNRTEAWWVGPKAVLAGESTALYGRNLSQANGTSKAWIFLKPASGAGKFLAVSKVNPYRVEFTVPVGTAAGDYQLWAHNGQGGRFGWSGPVTLQVRSTSFWHGQDQKVYSVKTYGAKGDGTTDDTSAVEAALSAAEANAPASLYFPAGSYIVRRGLRVPNSVRWVGDGLSNTKLKLVTKLSANGSLAMLDAHSASNVLIEKITLEAAGMLEGRNLLWLRGGSNLLVRNARINAWGGQAMEFSMDNVRVESSELISSGMFGGASEHVFFVNNKFRNTNDGESVYAGWGGSEFAMIGNDMANADESRTDGHGIGRFFVAQGHFGSMKHLYWGDNVSHNSAPDDCNRVDCNKGEQICFEMVSGEHRVDFVSATASSVTFRNSLDISHGQGGGGVHLVIVGGKGLGQRRKVVSASSGVAKLERPWVVIPDQTSQFALASVAEKAAIFNNKFEGRNTYSQHDSDSTAVLVYGNSYDVTIDRNTVTRMRHGLMNVGLPLGQTPVAGAYFNLFMNNKVSDSSSGLYVGTTFADSAGPGVFGGVGVVFRNNDVSDLTHIGVEFEMWDTVGTDYAATIFEHNRFKNLRYGFINALKLMWTYDGNFKTAPVESTRMYNTILYNNTFERGTAPQSGSVGFLGDTRNTWLNVGSTWTGFSKGNTGP